MYARLILLLLTSVYCNLLTSESPDDISQYEQLEPVAPAETRATSGIDDQGTQPGLTLPPSRDSGLQDNFDQYSLEQLAWNDQSCLEDRCRARETAAA